MRALFERPERKIANMVYSESMDFSGNGLSGYRVPRVLYSCIVVIDSEEVLVDLWDVALGINSLRELAGPATSLSLAET